MNSFPYDCCDDTVDLFIHYLYHIFKTNSNKITGHYYSKSLKCTCFHTWQMLESWIIDLMGNQFDNNPDISVKAIDTSMKGPTPSSTSCRSICDAAMGQRSWRRLRGYSRNLATPIGEPYLVTEHTISFLTQNYKGVGVKHINVAEVCVLPIPLPPLAEQKRIVEKVEELLAMCEGLRRGAICVIMAIKRQKATRYYY